MGKENGNQYVPVQMITPGPGDKFLMLYKKSDDPRVEFLATADISVSELIGLMVSGLEGIYSLIANDPKYAPSPVIQPFAGVKKIGG
jgi:hypothetical protein